MRAYDGRLVRLGLPAREQTQLARMRAARSWAHGDGRRQAIPQWTFGERRSREALLLMQSCYRGIPLTGKLHKVYSVWERRKRIRLEGTFANPSRFRTGANPTAA